MRGHPIPMVLGGAFGEARLPWTRRARTSRNIFSRVDLPNRPEEARHRAIPGLFPDGLHREGYRDERRIRGWRSLA